MVSRLRRVPFVLAGVACGTTIGARLSKPIEPVAVDLDSLVTNTEARDDMTRGRPLMSIDPRPRVLIIDDNPDLLYILGQLLAAEYEVITARRGEEGVTLAQTRHPDVVILDLQLPGMDGIEAGRWMKREAPTVPILVLTAMGKGESEHVLRSGCCDAFMAKPAPLHAIRAKVAELLSSESRALE